MLKLATKICMTDQEINIEIAKFCVWDWYAVEKNGWYYRSNGCGYTNRISEAGKYSKNDALKEILRGEPMSIVKIPCPEYCNDLNEMHEAEKFLEGSINWNKYTDILGKLRFYNPEIHCVRSFANIIVSAPAKERAKAFVKTIGKWEN